MVEPHSFQTNSPFDLSIISVAARVPFFCLYFRVVDERELEQRERERVGAERERVGAHTERELEHTHRERELEMRKQNNVQK